MNTTRTVWVVVDLILLVRSRERVQYAQDDIKLEIKDENFERKLTLLLEVPEHSSQEQVAGYVKMVLDKDYRFGPPLFSQPKDGEKYNILSMKSKDVDQVAHFIL